jgi:hypothetical protein
MSVNAEIPRSLTITYFDGSCIPPLAVCRTASRIGARAAQLIRTLQTEALVKAFRSIFRSIASPAGSPLRGRYTNFSRTYRASLNPMPVRNSRCNWDESVFGSGIDRTILEQPGPTADRLPQGTRTGSLAPFRYGHLSDPFHGPPHCQPHSAGVQ